MMRHHFFAAMSHQPLQGLKVIDVGRFIAGPLCGALLADLGADVIRVEPPRGAEDRFVTPLAGMQEGSTYLQMNRNKRSLAIDTQEPRGRGILRDLLRRSDVVVANMPARALAKLALDYDSLRALRDDIILTSVTAYGTQGPERDSIGFDGTGQAMSGAMHLTGKSGQPCRSATSYVDFGTAMAAAFGTLAAVMSRQATGRGQHVQGSLLRTALFIMNPILMEEASGTRSRVPTGNRSPISGPSDTFATADGWIMVQVLGRDMFERWTKVVDAPDWLDDPRFADDISRGENGQLLSERMAAWSRQRTTNECLQLLREQRVPASPVLAPRDTLAHPHISAGGFFEQFSFGDPAVALPLVMPVQMEATCPLRAAPELGADTAAILHELGLSPAQVQQLEEEGVVHCAPERNTRRHP
jgi:crotonobetainyl-CoA:carnitine CoA-transferase CaiB-like acyl-CoA transferase